jgi:hypothetical protein
VIGSDEVKHQRRIGKSRYIVAIDDDHFLNCEYNRDIRVCYASYANHWRNLKHSTRSYLAIPNARLVLDYYTGMPKLVSTRNIAIGHEIFIDYGKYYNV